MRGKNWVLLAMVLFLAIGMGCGGGGSSSGGSSSNAGTFVGTWNRVSFTGNGSAFAEQIIFNSNGTGSYSGTASGAGNFTWTHVGTQLSITEGGATQVLTAPALGSVPNTVTLTITTGGTATYNRA